MTLLPPRRSPSLRPLLAGAALLWLILLVGAYYAFHKPFGPDLALDLLVAGLHLAVPLLLTALGGGLGTRLTPGWELPPLARLAARAALGLGLLSLLGLALGNLLGVSRLGAWLALGAAALLLARPTAAWGRDLTDLRRLWRGGGKLGRALGTLLGVQAGLTLLAALAPPLKWDALVYHLALPQTYLAQGSLGYTPANIFWGMPEVGETLYTWAAALAGNAAAATLGWLFGIGALLGLLGWLEARLGARPAWVGTAALLAGSSLSAALGWAYIDWLTVLYGLTGMVVLDLWFSRGQRRDLILAGVAAGLAAGTKYTAVTFGLAAGLLILWQERRRGAGALRAATLFALAAGLTFAPWLLRNLLATGSPTYPLLFPAGAMDAARLDFYGGGPVWGDWRDLLLLPLRATLWGEEGGEGYVTAIGPLLLGLGLLAPLAWRREDAAVRRLLATAGGLALVGLAVWAVGGRLVSQLLITRLHLVIFPAYAALAALGFAWLARQTLPGVRLGRVAGALILLVVGLNTLQLTVAATAQGSLGAVLGLTSEAEYLAANLGDYGPAMTAVAALPPEARVVMLWETRGLYCQPRCAADEIIDRWWARRHRDPLAPPPTAAAILAEWRAAGFTHALVYAWGVQFVQDDRRYTPADWQAWGDAERQMTLLQDFGGNYRLYRLPDAP